jgi:hypothetical protein
MKVIAALTFHQQKSEGSKLINFISNLYNGKAAVTKNSGTIPDVVHNYNFHMGFVDQMDFSCLQHSLIHHLMNWKHAIFFWLLEAMIHNSSIIWNHLHPGTLDLIFFNHLVIQHFCNFLALHKRCYLLHPARLTSSGWKRTRFASTPRPAVS